MKKSDLKIDLEAQLAAIRAHKSGAKKLVTYIHDEPSPPAEIRKKLGLSQEAFAALLDISVKTLRNWEQDQRAPRGPARSLLRIAERHPEVLFN